MPGAQIKSNAGFHDSVRWWLPFIRSNRPTPPSGVLPPRRSGTWRAPSAPVPVVRSTGAAPSSAGHPVKGGCRRRGWGMPSVASFSSRTCEIFNRGLSVLSTLQPREGSSVSPNTTPSRVSCGGVVEGYDNRTPKGSVSSGAVRSVDCWPMAKNFVRFLGVSPARYPSISVDADWAGVSSSRGAHTAVPSTPSRAARVSGVDRALGNSVGAIGWSREPFLHWIGVPGAGPGSVLAPADSYFLPSRG